ncbi:MAG: anthranilate phosphoribosyltransferase [Fusobacteriaceae bacterium]|jgi:anthranilate phosphoribosyltransferase|nr:trpD [Fusobacteriales bacterium]MDN5305047.1 anthranilate phosphoribosyltransferase [Fusobacteriaceae bacterium]
MIREAIKKLFQKQDLTQEEMKQVMTEIMEGKVSEILISSFLTALRMKGETAEEITGGAYVMREKAEKVTLSDEYTIDTCGTGGDGANTYNISTTVAFVAAAAGIKVVKHGNRSVSSKSGSADVLEKLGVNIDLTPEQVKECVENTNLGFMFAPKFHKAMKYAVPVRKELKERTIFNVLGPLTNPAFAKGQVLGVFDESLTEIMANALKNLGTERALVVYGMDKLDEISACSDTKITELNNGEIQTYYISPKDFGMPLYDSCEIKGGSVEENANTIKELLQNKLKGAKYDILLLNAGAALYVGKKAENIREGVYLAKEIIESGKAFEKLNEFIEFTNR